MTALKDLFESGQDTSAGNPTHRHGGLIAPSRSLRRTVATAPLHSRRTSPALRPAAVIDAAARPPSCG
ncbi:MAG: hypothetical protein J6K19_04585 [Prevotella sp.]|nr:hypothetical protein [Prevotella sp.]